MKTEYCCGAQCQRSLQLAMETRKIFPSERILDALPATWYTCNVALGCKKIRHSLPALGYVASCAVYTTLKNLRGEKCKAASTARNKLATVRSHRKTKLV
ncbi:hypothetical protein ISCGN_005374 [Ixodes scapularis]